MKVALFSLGNMCTHSACAQALMKLGLVEKLRRLSSSPDAQVQKHCARIQVSVAIPPTLSLHILGLASTLTMLGRMLQCKTGQEENSLRSV